MTYYHAEAGGHKLRVLTHEHDLPVVVKLSCGAVAGAIAQTGGLILFLQELVITSIIKDTFKIRKKVINHYNREQPSLVQIKLCDPGNKSY